MPASDRPAIWTPRGRYRFFTNRGVKLPPKREYLPPPVREEAIETFRPIVALPYKLPPPVPITGVFAGLSPRQRKVDNGIADTAMLRRKGEEWLAEAAQIEGDVPSLSLEQQLGQSLVRAKVKVKELMSTWDSTRSGSILKTEFRTRFRALCERLEIPTPGFKALDDLFDHFDDDKSGVIEHNELVASLESLQSTGKVVMETHGAAYMEAMERAAGLRQRAGWAFQAIDTVNYAYKVEDEYNQLKGEVDADLRTQLGMKLVKRKIKAGDLVGKFASSDHGLKKADFREMVKSLNVSTAGEAMYNEVLWASQCNSLFEALDDDNSGAMDAREAVTALKGLMSTSASSMHKLDNKQRFAGKIRRKAERQVKRALAKPHERNGGYGSDDDGSLASPMTTGRLSSPGYSPDGLSSPTSSLGSPIRKLALDGTRSPTSTMGGLFSFRGSRLAQRQDPAKAKATKKRAIEAIKRMDKVQTSRSFNTWTEMVGMRAWNMALLKRAMGHLGNLEVGRGFGTWGVYYEQCLVRQRRREVLDKCLRRVGNRDLTRGKIKWKEYTMEMIEGKRLMDVAKRATASIKHPHLVAVFDQWKRDAESWALLQGDRRRGLCRQLRCLFPV